MLRVCRKNLEDNDGKLYFNNSLFSGIAYSFDSQGHLHDVVVVNDGTIQGIEKDTLLSADNDININFDYLAERKNEQNLQERYDIYCDPIYIHNGEIFKGFAYEFNDCGLLQEEAYYENGEKNTPYRLWYPCGTLKESNIREERNCWFKNGQQKSKEIFLSSIGEFLFSINFDESGKLENLDILENYKYDPSTFDNMKYSSKLTLSGSGVNDKLIDILFKSINFINITILDISYSNISPSKLLEIINKDIKQLELSCNKSITESTIDKIKNEFPQCEIFYEH